MAVQGLRNNQNGGYIDMNFNPLHLLFALIIGIFIGYILPRVPQHIEVTLRDDRLTFKSNRLQDGDTYRIEANGAVMCGVAVGGKWR